MRNEDVPADVEELAVTLDYLQNSLTAWGWPVEGKTAARGATMLRRLAAAIVRFPADDETLPLPTLLWERDKFIVEKGLWQEFVDQLPRGLQADVRLPAVADTTEAEKKAEKLVKALRDPDPAFRAVPNTVRQSAADITADLATAIRALAHRLIAKEAEVERLSRPTAADAREMQERCAQIAEEFPSQMVVYDGLTHGPGWRRSNSADIAAAIRTLPCPAVAAESNEVADRLRGWREYSDKAQFEKQLAIDLLDGASTIDSLAAEVARLTKERDEYMTAANHWLTAYNARVTPAMTIDELVEYGEGALPEPDDNWEARGVIEHRDKPADLGLETTEDMRAILNEWLANATNIKSERASIGRALLRDHSRLSAEVARLNNQSAELYKLQFEANERAEAAGAASAPAAAEEPK